MVLRSCSSLATSSFCPARVDTASVSWSCSSAQRTAKQSQGCHQHPKLGQGLTKELRNPPRAPEQLRASALLSSYVWSSRRDQAAIPAQPQGSSPAWGCPRVGTAPGKEQSHVPVPEAAACAGTAASKASGRGFWCPKGSWQQSRGSWRGMRGAEPMD